MALSRSGGGPAAPRVVFIDLQKCFPCACGGGVAQNGPSRDPYPSYDIVRTGKDALLVEMIGKSVKAREKHEFTP